MTTDFNWVDYTIIGIVGFSTIISFFRGFLREAISLIVWIVGILVALKFADTLQPHFQTVITSPGLRYAVAVVAIFLAVFIAGIILNAIVQAIVNKSGLSITDRFLGLFFGIGRGILIVSVLLMFMGITEAPKEGQSKTNVFNRSQLAPKFVPITSWLNGFLPKQIKNFSEWLDLQNSNDIDLGNH